MQRKKIYILGFCLYKIIKKGLYLQMECCVVSLNCGLAICPPFCFNGAFARGARLADALYASISQLTLDVICLQELIVKRDKILKSFIYHPYATATITSSMFGENIRFVHSGLAIVSKWPILEEDAHVFEGKSYHAEAFMSKAVQYCKILFHENQIVHVFNTHLQAWTNQKATFIRDNQMEQIATFMKKKLLCARPQEPIMLLGDFNVDWYENSGLFTALMDKASMYLVLPQTPQFSFDPSTNPLVGTDDATEYTIRNYHNNMTNNNNAGLENDAMSTFPKQLIDGVALSKNQINLVDSYLVNVVPILSPSPFEITVNISTVRMVRTISDHFAVRAQFIFKVQECAVRFKSCHQNMCNPKAHVGWLLLQIVLFLSILCVLFGACSILSNLKNNKHKKYVTL